MPRFFLRDHPMGHVEALCRLGDARRPIPSSAHFHCLPTGHGLLSSVNAFTSAGKLKGSSYPLLLSSVYISKLILTIS